MHDRPKEEGVRCTIRSYVYPVNPPPHFDLGKPLTQEYPDGTTLRAVIEDLLGDSGPVGLIAVNGKLVTEWEATLDHGDYVDIFPLLGGG